MILGDYMDIMDTIKTSLESNKHINKEIKEKTKH